MKSVHPFIQSAANWTLFATIFLLGVVMLPITGNFLFESKLYTVFLATTVMGVLYLIHSIQKKEAGLVFSRYTLPLFLFGTAVTASTFFTNNYPVESVLGFGGVIMSGVLYVFFASRLIGKDIAVKALTALGATAAVLTVATGAQMIGFGPANLINAVSGLNLPTTAVFNLAGSNFVALQFLIVTLIGFVAQTMYTKTISRSAAIMVPIIVVGIALHGFNLLPGKPGQVVLPSAAASWSVALDTIRSPRAALIGAGPASYSNLYLRFKPVWMNSGDNWNVPFSQASNMPLTLLTTTGFLGFFSWALLGYASVRAFPSVEKEEKSLAAMLVATFILQLFFPSNLVIIGAQLSIFAALIAAKRTNNNILRVQALTVMAEGQLPHEPARTKSLTFPVYVVALIIAGLLAFSNYMLFNFYRASMAVMAASQAAQDNDAVAVYENQQRAVALNPYLDTYRREYAVTNLLIASSLANKADATEAEQEQISALLQQAVREARSATVLDELDAQNWAVLAQIYQNMIGAVEQADQFAVQAYLAAVENSPTDPQLRLALGGLFLQAEQLQQAASIFQQAVNVKPDFANAHYNLAYTLEELRAVEQARNQYQQLLTLIDPQTEDYTTISEKVEELSAQVEELQAQQAAQQGDGTDTPATTGTQPSIIDQTLDAGTDITPATENDVQVEPGSTSLSEEANTTPPADNNAGDGTEPTP